MSSINESCESARLIAILVGVNEYDHGWVRLRGAINDVESIAVAIAKTHDPSRYALYVLTSSLARVESQGLPTKAGILAALDSAAKEATAADCIMFFFAGHGVLLGDRSYLLPKDGSPQHHITSGTLLSLEEIASRFANSPCQRRMMLLDACNELPSDPTYSAGSGEGTESAEVLSRGVSSTTYIKAYGQVPRGWVVLTACGPGQKSYEEESHGFFSEAIAQGLRGEADLDKDGMVTIAELTYYVTRRVRACALARVRQEQWPTIFVSAARLDEPVMPLAEYSEESELPYCWRRRSPGPGLVWLWLESFLKQWKVESFFSGRLFMWGIGVILTFIIAVQGIAFAPASTPRWWKLSLGAMACLGFIAWLLSVALAIAVAERRWHRGGYLPSFLIGGWLFASFAFLVLSQRWSGSEIMLDTSYLVVSTLALLFLLPIAALNALNTILSLSYLIERGEPVVVEEVLRQYDKRWWGVEIPNIVPVISANPTLYTLVVGLGASLGTIPHIVVVSTSTLRGMTLALVLLLDALTLLLAWWIVGWYLAAFAALKRRWWPQV